MKKMVFLSMVAAFVLAGFAACGSTPPDAAHNSQNSLNWDGVYTGLIPSASGPGTEVKLTLNLDGTYTAEFRYMKEPDNLLTQAGTFTWDKAGSVITLNEGVGGAPYYKVGENTLIQLDMSRKVITGDLANDYILKKQTLE